MSKMKLGEMLRLLNIESDSEQVVNDLCLDSRELKAGDVFLALSGFQVHGMDYAYQAERAGAIAVISEPAKTNRAKYVGRQKTLEIPVFEVPDLGAQLGRLAAAFYDHPSHDLSITAITGTNGKTSTAWLLMHALELLGERCGYIGTLGAGDVNQLVPQNNTTPSAVAVQRHLAEMRDQGIHHVCIEVSSHALDQDRFKGTEIDVAVYTNLSRDHLDYHKTMRAYAEAKLKLFTNFDAKHVVLNLDDAVAASWLKDQALTGEVHTYALYNQQAAWRASDVQLLPQGVAFKLNLPTGAEHAIQTQLLGGFNVENMLAVMQSLTGHGHDVDEILKVIDGLQPVPGRMNKVNATDEQSIVVVDYAHTPDALEQVLQALRSHAKSDLWCVFGCGGNRDKGKRPMMGAIAEQYADHVILTDDNPRFESSSQIMADIEFGMKTKPHTIGDRRQAIAYALDHSHPGDIILVAGKGHESTQEVNGDLLPFNDIQVVNELVEAA